ncbi:MAG: oligosaccharide flippase family protein, partial [Actinomycetota bacterium]|nr:oligosaccharide flippase family protein [Actinomycetota bacterium]
MNGHRQLLRASAGLSMTRVLTLILQALHFALIARLLDTAWFSGFVAGTALALIVHALAEFGLVHTIVLALRRATDDSRTVLRVAVTANLVLLGAAVSVAGAAAGRILPSEGVHTFWLMLPATVCLGLQQPFIAYRRHRLEFSRLALADFVGRALPVVCLVPIFALGRSWAASTHVVAIVVGLFAGALVALCLVIPARPLHALRPGRIRPGLRLIGDAAPLGATTALSLVHTRVDQIVLSAYGYRLALASYAVAYRLLDAALAVVVAASGVALPALAKADGRERVQIAQGQVALLGIIAVLSGSAVFVFAPQLVVVLGGERYASAAWFARLLSPALVVSVLNVGPAMVAIVQDRAKALLPIALFGVTLNLVLNLALAGRYGASAAAVVTVASETVGLLLVARVARRALPGSVSLPVVFVSLGGFTVACFGGLLLLRAVGPLVGS